MKLHRLIHLQVSESKLTPWSRVRKELIGSVNTLYEIQIFYYHVYKTPTLDTTIIKMNVVHILIVPVCKILFNCILLCLDLVSGLFPLGFLTKIMDEFFISSIRADDMRMKREMAGGYNYTAGTFVAFAHVSLCPCVHPLQ
jgi:membrane protein required for beta-lactamase induction